MELRLHLSGEVENVANLERDSAWAGRSGAEGDMGDSLVVALLEILHIELVRSSSHNLVSKGCCV